MTSPLFTEDFARRVAALRMTVRGGAATGNARAGSARPAAAGYELRDFRPYAPGDDPRAIDWHAFARLEQAVVRRFDDAAPREWRIVLDRSASMGSFRGDRDMDRKDRLARQLAGATGLLALAAGARVSICGEPAAPATAASFLMFVERLPAAPAVFTEMPRSTARVDYCILTDGYPVPEITTFLDAARRSGGDVVFCAIWGACDREPPASDCEVVDMETGAVVQFTEAMAAGFRRRFAAFELALRHTLLSRGIPFLVMDPAAGFEPALMQVLQTKKL